MIPGSLTDLDPARAPERRWPFYVAWTMGGIVVGAVMLSHLPVQLVHAPEPVAAPVRRAAPAATLAPVPLRFVPVPLAPPRP
jgi:hypothetical protein